MVQTAVPVQLMPQDGRRNGLLAHLDQVDGALRWTCHSSAAARSFGAT